jgi:hypothetical protein
MAKPDRFASMAAILPLAFSTCCLALADGAAPSVPFLQNPISLILSVVIAVACAVLCVPRVSHWNWEAKYFGVTLFCVGSIALICLVPCFCLALYGRPSVVVRIIILCAYMAIHIAWCRRFFAFYEKINSDINLRKVLYEEEDDAVYYMQQGDRYLLETQYKFKELPKDRYFAIFLLLAFLLVPAMNTLRAATGLPFTHIFLLIAMLPVSLMGVGFAARGWLVFYYYPRQIRKGTGKRVYVDMSGKPKMGRKHKGAKILSNNSDQRTRNKSSSTVRVLSKACH